MRTFYWIVSVNILIVSVNILIVSVNICESSLEMICRFSWNTISDSDSMRAAAGQNFYTNTSTQEVVDVEEDEEHWKL